MMWFAGAAACSVRLLAGWISATSLRRSHHAPAPPAWQQALDRLMKRMHVSRPVRLLATDRVDSPSVVGWLRPVILAPAGVLCGLAPEQVEALLAHELAHVLRHDYLVNLLQGVAEAVLFYHPAVWWVSSQIRAERELCCDDLAVAASGDVLTYARALAELETLRPSRARLAIAADGGSLLKRIARLIEPARPTGSAGAAWAMSVLLILGAGALAIRAQTPGPRGPDPTI